MPLQKKDYYGIGVIALVIIIVIFLMNALIKSGEDDIDDSTGCYKNKKIGHIVVLTDLTDPFTFQQKKLLENLINQFKRNKSQLNINEKLSIYMLQSENPTKPEAIFSACRSLRGEEVNPLTQGPDYFEKQFIEKFETKLNAAYNKIASIDKKSEETNLLEMIFALSLKDDFKSDYPRRRLIIFSDMLHHNKNFSLYGKNTVSYKEEVSKNKKYFEDKVKPSFGSGVTVALYILKRENQPTAAAWDKVRQFWIEYFKSNGINLNPKKKCDDSESYDGCVYVQP